MFHSIFYGSKASILVLLILLCVSSQEAFGQWNLIHQDSTEFEVSDVYFFNNDTGLVCGNIYHAKGFVLRTTDGGITWNNSASNVYNLMTMFFLNDTVGFAGAQDGIIYRTTDQGITWNYFSTVNSYCDFDGFNFINDSIGFVKCYLGTICKTIDGGATWTYIKNIQSADYFYHRKMRQFFFSSDSIGFAVGNGVYKTTDQGTTWVRQNADTLGYYRSIFMLNSFEGFAVGNKGALLHTIDGGSNWILDSISNQDLRQIVFLNHKLGYCIGGGFGYSNDTCGIIMQTDDGGSTWSTITISNIRLNSVQFIDSVAYAVGNYGNIFKNSNYFMAVDNITADVHFEVWPNPASKVLNYSISNTLNSRDITLMIYDINGKLLSEENVSKSGKIDLSKLESGFYFVKLTLTSKDYMRKIVIIQE